MIVHYSLDTPRQPVRSYQTTCSIGSSSYLVLTGDHQVQVKPGTEVVVDAGVVLVVSVDDLEVVDDIAESIGGPGKSRLLGESNSTNGSGVLFVVNFAVVVVLIFVLEVVVFVVVVSLDLFAIHCNQLRAST